MKTENQLVLTLCGAAALLISACASETVSTLPETRAAAGDTQAANADQSTSRFPAGLALCPFMSVSNAPAPVQGLSISGYKSTFKIGDVRIATAPIAKGCLSSGFGPRNGRNHKGIDLHNADPVEIYSAGAGIVKEKTYRDDYGNMLVIDHGRGVFTRYAHLESFTSGLNAGDRVLPGQTIGVMGNTAGYRIPRHLHYEVLTGEWGARAGSFALSPVDIFAAMSGN